MTANGPMSGLGEHVPERRFGWWDMFVPEDEDPRADGGLTLEMKCDDLDAEQMARQSVPPSDLSLLGLVRHLAGVERYWFRRVLAGEEVTRLYRGPDDEDLAFVVASDPAMVQEAGSTPST